jgi:hypothetical protein
LTLHVYQVILASLLLQWNLDKNNLSKLITDSFESFSQGDSISMEFFKRTNKPVKKPSPAKRKRQERKDFSYYMQLTNFETQELVGHLADISSGGFKLDSSKPIPPNTDIKFHMQLTNEVANKSYMVFIARSKWCKVDPLDPFCYNVGFQIINISPADIEIFKRIMEKYGTKHEKNTVDWRRTNRW